ncbi:1074_t:CDS:1 [Scutellospora calospora]|uniref:1074_t:CDS:1 n=1 Tax=Scutellospora calospora TaxID=85575 RepID=A0ACA9MG04_9GLOM|nr:1074_t:CDS:1 [Scutellospora calospora]
MNPHSTQILTKKIEPDNKSEPHISIDEQISRIFNNPKVYAISFDVAANSKPTVLENIYCTNGFATAILHAYNYHKHLRLSPDDIWLTIAQGVSSHINYNAEKFRHKFVKHEGKKNICIFVGDIISGNTLEGDWQEAVDRLVMKVDENVEKIELKELLECDFSTTTSTSLTASRIVLLDMVKAYFSYEFSTLCGIPKVTLEGTLEDWNKLQEKVIRLRKLDLELDFWLDRLEPVIWNLVATYRGEIDEDFWGRIMRIDEVFGSGGGTYISGWMLAFFPYSRLGKPFSNERTRISNIPDGMIEVPFIIDGNISLKFIAGFVGANQEILENSNNESIVSPIIGWFITDDVKDSSDS